MKLLEKIDKLMLNATKDERIKVGEIIISLTEYVTCVAKKEMKNHLRSRQNEELKIETEAKYERCAKELVELNEISNRVLGQKIYDKEFEKDEIENFLQELLNEIYKNRRVSRK